MQYVVDIRQGSIRHVVSGILAVAPVSPPTSLSNHYRPEKCWRILNRSAVGQSHKCSTKTYVCKYKLLFWQENFSDAVMSKVCQNFTIGDFSFYITTGFTPIKERSHFKTSKGSQEQVKRMIFHWRVKRPLLYPVSLLFGCWDTEIQISRTKII